MTQDRFIFTTTDDPRAKVLNDALLQEYDRLYGTFFDPRGAIAEMERYPPADFFPNQGNFGLLLRNNVVIGGGGFKFYNPQCAELKRIWICPNHRRQGLAARILQELEQQAVKQGYQELYLTTGYKQPAAVELYLKNGYQAQFDLQEDREALRKLPFRKKLIIHKQAQSPQSRSI